jgi:replicative DNA helicase
MSENLPAENTLPHNIEAEQAVLGAILLDPVVFNQAAQLLLVEDFFFPSHRKIFEKMAALSEQSKAIDMVTLNAEILRSGDLETVGGTAYIASLVNGLPRTENIEQYANIVREKSVLRRLIELSNDTMANCLKGDRDPSTLLEETERSIFAIAEHHIKTGFQPVERILHGTIDELEKRSRDQRMITGVATGFKKFDEMTAGLQPADMIVVAARPSMGKTAWCLNLALNAALAGDHSVGIFSLEMSQTQLVLRFLSTLAQTDHQNLRTGYISKGDWIKIHTAREDLRNARLYIDDTAVMSVVEMRSKARRLKLEFGLDLLIIDYLQLMGTREQDRRRQENRNQEIAAISRAIKGLAKELKIPVIAVSQLSRAPEQRTDHRPQLSDLRESGSIEQDADVVAFVHREDRFKKDENTADTGIAEIIIAKQRNGPCGTAKLIFLDKFMKFVDPAPGELEDLSSD